MYYANVWCRESLGSLVSRALITADAVPPPLAVIKGLGMRLDSNFVPRPATKIGLGMSQVHFLAHCTCTCMLTIACVAGYLNIFSYN